MTKEKKITAGTVAVGAGKGLLKFIVGLICYLVAIAINLLVFLVTFGTLDVDFAMLLGAGVSIVFALIIFIVPFLRKMKSVKWLAWVALGDAAWWIYNIITNL